MSESYLKTWTHPGTGETRIYANSWCIEDAKVWMERKNDSYIVKGRYEYAVPNAYSRSGKCWAITAFMEVVEDLCNESGRNVADTFDGYLALAA